MKFHLVLLVIVTRGHCPCLFSRARQYLRMWLDRTIVLVDAWPRTTSMTNKIVVVVALAAEYRPAEQRHLECLGGKPRILPVILKFAWSM